MKFDKADKMGMIKTAMVLGVAIKFELFYSPVHFSLFEACFFGKNHYRNGKIDRGSHLFMYQYQETKRYFAQVSNDIKDIGEQELISLGGKNTQPIYRGIYFTASQAGLYAINLHSRLLNRVLAPLITFRCHSDRYLYKRASQIHWEDFLSSTDTFAVFANVSHSAIKHSKFAALRLKDTIADYFRVHTGKRPTVNTQNPKIWFNLHIENNFATISVDTSGGALHKRGYRKIAIEAPMIETIAAAIIRHTEWNGDVPLYDPFCGSGTFLCEAFMHASRIPSAFLRKNFGFQYLPDFEPLLWEKIRNKAEQSIAPASPGMIKGSDISLKAVKATRHNCAMIDPGNHIEVIRQDFFDVNRLLEKVIICNPPYGIRLGKSTDLFNFYEKFGDVLKKKGAGSSVYVYFGNRKYIKNIGLKPSWKKALSTGGLDGRLVKYEIY